jgi:hypothetical protein
MIDGCWPNLTSPKLIVAAPTMAAVSEIVPIFMPEIGSVHYVNEHFCAAIIGEGIARVMSRQSLGL